MTKKKNRSIETLVKFNTGILVFFLVLVVVGGILVFNYIMPYINDLNNLSNLSDQIPQP